MQKDKTINTKTLVETVAELCTYVCSGEHGEFFFIYVLILFSLEVVWEKNRSCLHRLLKNLFAIHRISMLSKLSLQ